MTKTVAERLRDFAALKTNVCFEFREIVTGVKSCTGIDCVTCRRQIANVLAAMIEVKQAEPQLPEGVIWPRYDDGDLVRFGHHIAQQLENPKDLTRELNGGVRSFTFAVDYLSVSDGKDELCFLYGEPVKRPEPEVLDADGVPIKVGDTVWYTDGLPEKKFVGDRCTVKTIERVRDKYSIKVFNEDRGYFQYDLTGKFLTHRKPDTLGDIKDEATLPPREYCNRHQLLGADGAYFDEAEATVAMCWHLIDRTRKLLGGE